MFEVSKETAALLFHAQDDRHQGVLRLDISSRGFPSDWEQPIHWTHAGFAIGERVLDAIRGCAIDHELLENEGRRRYPDDRYLVAEDNRFQKEVANRLADVLGIDPETNQGHEAFRKLLEQLREWVKTSRDEEFVMDDKDRLHITFPTIPTPLPRD